VTRCVSIPYNTAWWLRSWMDFLINGVARDIILFTFPLLICVEGPLDFVKDCTAIFFLTQLDDIDESEAKTITQMLARIKFNLFFEHRRDHPEGPDMKQEDRHDTKYSKGIPLRLTYNEQVVADGAEEDSWDQFEVQRQWTFNHLQSKGSEDNPPKFGPQNGVKYLMENMAYYCWTAKGVEACGKIIDNEMDEADPNNDRENCESDELMDVGQLKVIQDKLLLFSKPQDKGEVKVRKGIKKDWKKLISKLSSRKVREGEFDLDDIAEALKDIGWVREMRKEEQDRSDDSSGDEKDSDDE